LTLTRFWDPSPLVESARVRLPEARERLIALLDQAVRRTVTGHDAVTLSGGIDSPTVAAFAAAAHRAQGRPLQAINTSYPDFPSVEEGTYARQVADYLGIPLRTHVLSGSPLTDIETWAALADGPWDTLPMPVVVQTYQLARRLGARTILTGELAEYVYTVSQSLLGHLFWHGRWRALRAYADGLIRQGRSRRTVVRRLLREAAPATVLRAYARLRDRRSYHFPDWVDVTAVGGSPYREGPLERPWRRWRRAQFLATRGTTSTMEADEIAAAYCGVRVRRPLADVDLWEFFLSLPAEVKFPDPVPKAIVRQAMRSRLPDAVLDRRTKTVFDEYALGTADFEGLLRWTDPAQYRMRGVDYERLRSALEERRVTLNDLLWAYDLAKAHAFVTSTGWTRHIPPLGYIPEWQRVDTLG
jgi:asparagine synthase (glutamine-hydrolysing)